MGKRRKKQTLPATEGAAASGSGIAAPAPHSKIDYSKFDNIEESDEDDYDKYANDMACRPGCPFHNHDCAGDHPPAEDDGEGNSEADECEEYSPSQLGMEWVKNTLDQAKGQMEREQHAQQQGVKGLGNSTLPTASKKKQPALRQGFFNFGGSKPVHESLSQPNAASSTTTHSSPADELYRSPQSKQGEEMFRSLQISDSDREAMLRRLQAKDNDSDGPPPLQDGSERDSEESDADGGDSGEESEGPPDLTPGSEDSDAEEPPAKKGKAKAGAKPSGPAPAVSEPATTKAAKAVEASPSAGASTAFTFTFDKSNPKPAPAPASQATGSRPTKQTNGSKQSRAAAPLNRDKFPGFVSDEEEVEQFKISVACGAMDEALAKRLRSGEFKRGAADSPPAFTGPPQSPAAGSSASTAKSAAASKPAAAKAQPALAKASARRSGTAAATQPPASEQKAAKSSAANTVAAAQQPAANAAAAGPSQSERRKAGKKLQVEETSDDDDDQLQGSAGADSRKPQTVQPQQQAQNKDEAPPAQGMGETAEEIRQRKLKEAEEHFKSLLEEEEAGRREREQQAKLQEERDAARREKRKAKAKKKKGKAGKGTASQERPPPQPGEAVSADVEQEDEEPPASAADVASSSAVAPAASGSAVKSAGPTPRSLREEEEAAFNAGSDGDGDGDAGPGATSSNPFDVLNPARAAARPAPKVAAAQKVKPSGSSAGKQPGARQPKPIPAVQRAAEPPASLRPPPPPPAPYLPTEMPRPTGYAPPALSNEATRVWSAMEAALHAGTAQALTGAISAASAWLTAHGTSKLWMAANNALRDRLQRARHMLATAQGGGEPGAGPGLQRQSPAPRPTHKSQQLHHPGTGRGMQPPPGYAPPLGAAAQYPHDPADPFGGVAMGGRQRGVHRPSSAWQPAAGMRPAFRPQAATAPPPPPARLQEQPLTDRASLPMAFDTVVAVAHQGGHEEDKNDCIVCMDAPMDVILVPCGHSNLCSWCANAVKQRHEGLCPTCREPIKEILQATAA